MSEQTEDKIKANSFRDAAIFFMVAIGNFLNAISPVIHVVAMTFLAKRKETNESATSPRTGGSAKINPDFDASRRNQG